MRPGNLYAKNGKNAEQSTLSSESKWWYNHRLKVGKLAKSFSFVMNTMVKKLNLALGIVRHIMVAGEVERLIGEYRPTRRSAPAKLLAFVFPISK
jgi:hypothetical protein